MADPTGDNVRDIFRLLTSRRQFPENLSFQGMRDWIEAQPDSIAALNLLRLWIRHIPVLTWNNGPCDEACDLVVPSQLSEQQATDDPYAAEREWARGWAHHFAEQAAAESPEENPSSESDEEFHEAEDTAANAAEWAWPRESWDTDVHLPNNPYQGYLGVSAANVAEGHRRGRRAGSAAAAARPYDGITDFVYMEELLSTGRTPVMNRYRRMVIQLSGLHIRLRQLRTLEYILEDYEPEFLDRLATVYAEPQEAETAIPPVVVTTDTPERSIRPHHLEKWIRWTKFVRFEAVSSQHIYLRWKRLILTPQVIRMIADLFELAHDPDFDLEDDEDGLINLPIGVYDLTQRLQEGLDELSDNHNFE